MAISWHDLSTMHEVKRYQVRGVPGEVSRLDFNGRTVEFWSPKQPASHLLIAHDGQNVFDGRTSTHRGQTWKMAQSAIRVSKELGITPPSIIAIWHSSTKADPWGRAKDLTPERYFREGLSVPTEYQKVFNPEALHGDSYLTSIFDEYVPALAPGIPAEQIAMIGSSMGGLATLYALANFSERFTTALALSPHWPFGGEALVDRTISSLPAPSKYKVWMSHGTKGLDRDYLPFQQIADQLMKSRGYHEDNFRSKRFIRSGHNERSWAKYLHEPLNFWLN
ncbi:MAG: alpha/beta hydrolase-fold protein [Actinomycetota bacterium]